MSFKTILVNCEAGKAALRRLEVATQLASLFNSVLVGLHANPPFEPLAFEDVNMVTFFEAYRESGRANRVAAHVAFDQAIKGKRLSTEWRPVDGRADDLLIACSRYADLVVVGQSGIVGQPEIEGATMLIGLPESVTLASGRPVLVVPHSGAGKPIGGTVMLCWNASRESARAAADALPLLKVAQKVIVLVVDPKSSSDRHDGERGADIATWLARHGVKVTVQRDVAPTSDVGNVILARAVERDVDLIVMGLYGHSRLRERVLGGVSRAMLSTMTVPVLMTH